jgi:hypothetical protein
MPTYRLYTLTSECHIAGPPNIVDCYDDQAAVVRAKQALDGHSIEIRNGSRLVGRLNPESAPTGIMHAPTMPFPMLRSRPNAARCFQKV